MTVIGRGLIATEQVTKTIAFDGSAGNGATGDVVVFTITGRVWLLGLTAFCTEDLTEGGATATVQLGTPARDGLLIAVVNAVDIDNNEWWTDGTPVSELDQMDAAQVDVLLSANIVILVSTQAVSNGTIVFDAYYIPITSNGALA